MLSRTVTSGAVPVMSTAYLASAVGPSRDWAFSHCHCMLPQLHCLFPAILPTLELASRMEADLRTKVILCSLVTHDVSIEIVIYLHEVLGGGL